MPIDAFSYPDLVKVTGPMSVVADPATGALGTITAAGTLTAASVIAAAILCAGGVSSLDGNGGIYYGNLRGQGESAVGALQTLTGNGQTITIPAQCTLIHITGASAWTGLIMTAGSQAGQQIILINDSANTQTFAAAGTSRVSLGAAVNVPANGKLLLVWSANLSLWF